MPREITKFLLLPLVVVFVCVVFFLVIATMEEETTDDTMAVDVGIYVVLLCSRKRGHFLWEQIRQILREVDQAESRQFLDFWIKVDKCRDRRFEKRWKKTKTKERRGPPPPKKKWVHAIKFKSWKSFSYENGPSVKHFWKVEDIPSKWRTMCKMIFNFLFGLSVLTLKFIIYVLNFLLAILCSSTIQIKKLCSSSS